MVHRWLRRAATVALLLGAVAVVGPLSPARAAPCSGTAGVTVVVEFNQLGGGSAQSCVSDGGGQSADRLLKEAGYSLDYVQRFPGFVCRIDGLPADDPCVNTPPADAYWGLWWSDGTTGKWTYSSLGAASLSVPAGGSVAMVWDGSAGTVAPNASPTVHPTPTPTPTLTPTPTPTPTPTKRPSPTPPPTSSAPPPTSVAPSSTSASPTGKPTKEPTKKPTAKPTRTARPTETPATAEASPSATTSDSSSSTVTATRTEDDDAGGLPGWVPPLLVAALLAVTAGVAVVRRRGR